MTVLTVNRNPFPYLSDSAPSSGALMYCRNENIAPRRPPNKTDVTGSSTGIRKKLLNDSTQLRTVL
jgi:hypothetical protein